MNKIESSAVILGDVTFGSGNYIGHNSLLIGPLKLGNDNYIGNMVTIGTSAQDDILTPFEHNPEVLSNLDMSIGDRNTIREYVTIHRGLTTKTVVGNDNYLMAYAHIAHDCVIQNRVKIANAVQMGGFSTIQDDAYLGLSAVLHQFTVIGAACMIGMNSTVTSATRPGSTYAGTPARFMKPNTKGLSKYGLNNTDWWGKEEEHHPKEYLELLSLFEGEVEARRSQSLEIQEWRKIKLQNRFN